MENENNGHNEQTVENIGTKAVVLQLLRKLGCNPECMEDGSVTLYYQRMQLALQFTVNSVRIWHTSLLSVDLYHIDMSKFLGVVNRVNLRSRATIVIDPRTDESGKNHVFCKTDVVFPRDFKDDEEYLKLGIECVMHSGIQFLVEVEDIIDLTGQEGAF